MNLRNPLMIKIYLSASCASCRKVKAWFKNENIPFEEINLNKHKITQEELKEMLNKSLNGTEDIISTRAKVFKDHDIDIDSMSLSELLDFVVKNPTVLKRPIIVDDHKIQVGYNADEIEIFEKVKKLMSKTCTPECCPNYPNCEHPYTK